MPSISRIPSDAQVIGAICGVCGADIATATHAPDFCGHCRARFDRGDPMALVYLDVALTGPAHAEIEPCILVEYRGRWTAEAKDQIERGITGDE